MKPAKIQQRLELKNAILRAWLEQGVPEAYRLSFRNSIRWYAKWNDSQIGVEAVTNPNQVSKSGPYGSLVCEAEELLQLIFKKVCAGRPTKGEENARLKSDVDALRELNRKLASQWHAERAKVLQLEDKLGTTKRCLARAEETIRELRQKLSVILPIQPVPLEQDRIA